ncbi:MAG: Nif3-like dinuclear metal center hexameric protein [Saprospiraceae bacterium]
MSVKVKEIIDYLHSIAPNELQESYDNAGLIVGSENNIVKKVMVSLDTTPAVIDDAIKQGCNLVVSHHPIVFKGIKRFIDGYYVHDTVIKAIKNDISIFAIHTNLDNVYLNGVSTKMAEILGLSDVKILLPTNYYSSEFSNSYGAGAIGILSNPIKPTYFISHVKEKFQLQCLKYTDLCRNAITKVAVCGGSGSFLIQRAIDVGADVLITSDVKYHEFFDANGQIIILDIGHYESEKHVIRLLADLLKSQFTPISILETSINTNPVSYSA